MPGGIGVERTSFKHGWRSLSCWWSKAETGATRRAVWRTRCSNDWFACQVGSKRFHHALFSPIPWGVEWKVHRSV